MRKQGLVRALLLCFIQGILPLAFTSKRTMISMSTAVNRAQTMLQEFEARPQHSKSITREKPRHLVGVFLLNLGGPESAEDVEPFLYNLFADPDIIRLPPVLTGAQTALAWLIAKRRAPRSRAAYDTIGGGSPITRYTRAQAQLLEDALNEEADDDVRFKCYVAMRYWRPFTDEALDQADEDGVSSAVILPLYPHFSISTTGSSLRALLAEMQASHPRLFAAHTVVPSWHSSPGYVDIVARLIRNEIDALPEPKSNDKFPPAVLFSAHGVPLSYIEEQGDPYKRHIEETVHLVAQAVKRDLPSSNMPTFELSFQSRVGPVEWLRPYTDDALIDIAQRGVRRCIVVPISFVSEHIETLEEIDMEYKEIALDAGIEHWRRVPALNLEPDFILELKKQVFAALYQKPAISTSEACVVHSFDPDAESFLADVLPEVQSDVSLINSRTAAIALALTAAIDLLANSRAIHVFGLGAV